MTPTKAMLQHAKDLDAMANSGYAGEMTVREALGYFYSVMLVEISMHGTLKPYLEKYLERCGYLDMAAASFPSVLMTDAAGPRSADRVFNSRTKLQRFFWMFVMFCEVCSLEYCVDVLKIEPKDSDVARLDRYSGEVKR